MPACPNRSDRRQEMRVPTAALRVGSAEMNSTGCIGYAARARRGFRVIFAWNVVAAGRLCPMVAPTTQGLIAAVRAGGE